MSSSYYRKCRTCGQSIQLRKMPGGQWVAFEGYEQVHECKKPKAKRVASGRPARAGKEWRAGAAVTSAPNGALEDLGFDDFELPAGVRTARETETPRPAAAAQSGRRKGARTVRASPMQVRQNQTSPEPTPRFVPRVPPSAQQRSGIDWDVLKGWLFFIGAALLLFGMCRGL